MIDEMDLLRLCATQVGKQTNEQIKIYHCQYLNTEKYIVCLFVCLTGRPCGTRLGIGTEQYFK